MGVDRKKIVSAADVARRAFPKLWGRNLPRREKLLQRNKNQRRKQRPRRPCPLKHEKVDEMRLDTACAGETHPACLGTDRRRELKVGKIQDPYERAAEERQYRLCRQVKDGWVGKELIFWKKLSRRGDVGGVL